MSRMTLFCGTSKMYWAELLQTGVGMGTGTGMGIGAGAAQAVMAAERAMVTENLMAAEMRDTQDVRESIATSELFWFLRKYELRDVS